MQSVQQAFPLLLCLLHILLWWLLAGHPLSGPFFARCLPIMLMNPSSRVPPKPPHCELCGRLIEVLTRHHLVPRTRHRKKRNQRLFSREDVRTRILWICRPCHDHIHDVLSEKDMEAAYHSREALLAHPEIQRFVDWLSRKPAGFKPAGRPARSER